MAKIATFDLPAPPSLNAYWKRWRGRIVISEKGRLYRQAVVAAIKPLGIVFTGKVAVTILYSGPMDLDNLNKCLLDALEKAGLYRNDNDIDDLRLVRVPSERPAPVAELMNGKISVEVRDL